MPSLQKGGSNRQNHFSNQLCTHSRQEQMEQPYRNSQDRKKSASSAKKYADIDKLIGQIKITPAKNNKYIEHLNNIKLQLQELKELAGISDQLRTIELLVNSLFKKVNSQQLGQSVKSKIKENPFIFSHHKTDSVSPIKQFDDVNSQIVYTNFSIKELNTQSKYDNCCQLSKKESNPLQTPVKKYILDQDQSQEIEKINSQIKVLEQLLKNKGVNDKIDFKEHLSNCNRSHQSTNSSQKLKYMQSENLCPPFRKKSTTIQSHQKISTTLISQRKNTRGFR